MTPIRQIVACMTLLLCAPLAWAAEEAPHFSIMEYRVLGNSVLATRDIETLLYPLLGEDKSIDDVEGARRALEALYRDRGYGTVFIDIPEQRVADGIVRLHVTEGRVDRVRATGARYYANGDIRAALPAATSGEVLHLPALQEQLGKLNNRDSRDLQITPVLKAGRQPGTVDLELKVKDSLPLHASVEVNDRYTANTTRTRASLQVSYDNLFQRDHSLALQYQTAPEERSEVRMLGATYMLPVGQSGKLIGYAIDTNSSFSGLGDAGGFSVLGAGRIYGLRFMQRLPSDGAGFQTLTFGADDKDFRDDIALDDDTSDSTPIHYVNWQLSWAYNRFEAQRATGLSIDLNFGIRGLGNSPAEFAFKRYRAKANYVYLRFDAQHERPLASGLSIFGRLQGQYTPGPLISNEQLAMGGADTVRGYLESAQLGDRGLGGTLELRSNFLQRLGGDWLSRATVFAFMDGAVLTRVAALPGEDARSTLMSTGLGLRIAALGGLQAALDWAYPLRNSGDTLSGDHRLHFRLRYEF